MQKPEISSIISKIKCCVLFMLLIRVIYFTDKTTAVVATCEVLNKDIYFQLILTVHRR